MSRVIRFLTVLPLLVFSGASTPRLEIPEADQIANWTAPQFWTPAGRARGRARTASVITASAPLPFIALPPCRIVDTRGNGFVGAYGPPSLSAGSPRNFTLVGQCGIPASAGAVSLNVTVTNTQGPGFIQVYPQGDSQPTVSTLNYAAGQTAANAAVALLGLGGGITVIAGVSGTDLILDTNGYYDGSSSLQLSLSRRAALDQFWTPQNPSVLGVTTVGDFPEFLKADGADIWVTGLGGTVSRVRASDGKLVGTWTGASGALGIVVAMGRVVISGNTNPGSLYAIDPTQPPGAVTTVASNLGLYPVGLAFDGARFWTPNTGVDHSISIITPSQTLPWAVTNVTTGFVNPAGVVFDGASVWVTDNGAGTLLRLDSSGSILQTVSLNPGPERPIFDGKNIWVTSTGSASLAVVRASDGAVLATLTGNGLSASYGGAFDGERVLVSNAFTNTVSLWRASDFAPLGSFSVGSNTHPLGVCSDGINFWIAMYGTNQVARF